MSSLSLSIVIPTFNGRSILSECLESVSAHRPENSEVVVVDDASTDGTADWLSKAYPEVRLVSLHENQGFCKAINAGIEASTGDIIETLNNDVRVRRGWAEEGLRPFDDPSVASVAPLVWLGRQPGLIDSAGMEYHLAGFARNRGNRQTRSDRFRCAEEVFGATASAAFYRRESLLSIGLFPEHFTAYYDDVHVAFQLARLGFRCIFAPDCQVEHHESFSYKQTLRSQQWFFRNEEQVFWDHLDDRVRWFAVARHFGYIMLRAAESVPRGFFRHYVTGKAQGLRQAFNSRNNHSGGPVRLDLIDQRFAARTRDRIATKRRTSTTQQPDPPLRNHKAA